MSPGAQIAVLSFDLNSD